jgi:Tfp pilus assembly protein PilX
MSRHRRALADERGFTMITVMLTMMVVGLFAVGAWAAASGDIPTARADQDRKRAWEAAHAGLEWYAYQLERDPAYWTNCATVPQIGGQAAPVNLEADGAAPDNRVWRSLPASNEAYTLEILRKRDANGNPTTQCSTSDPGGTALQDNTLRIRATGRANGETRSIIGTFKRRSMLDFVYFTQWETRDPMVSGISPASQCDKPRSQRSNACAKIVFLDTDQINGPTHTNDESVLVCNSPTFGRIGKNDAFEAVGPDPGYVQNGGCSGSPDFNGPKSTPATPLTMPTTNTQLKTYATPAWTFTGQTCLDFKGLSLDVYKSQSWSTNGRVTCSGNKTTYDLTPPNGPPNGVIYVDNGTCGVTYNYRNTYNNPAGCGDVAIRGTYSTSLTIGAANDIVIAGDLTKSGNNMLGLIATNFVRVYHPVASSCGNEVTTPAWDGTAATPWVNVQVNTIDAAMLSLQHSFIVDNYDCGSPRGNLNVTGAIAQYYRGPVGTGNGTSASTGYVKNYNYDDRLKYKEPPNFLDPVQTSWRIVRQSEQQPATKW